MQKERDNPLLSDTIHGVLDTGKTGKGWGFKWEWVHCSHTGIGKLNVTNISNCASWFWPRCQPQWISKSRRQDWLPIQIIICVMYDYKYHCFLVWPWFTWFLYGPGFLLSTCVSTSCTFLSLYKNAAMLRYNITLSPIENQRPRCNKRATRVGYVSTPEAFTPSSEDWSLYAQHFQHFLLVKGITEESQKLHLLLALVGGQFNTQAADKFGCPKTPWRTNIQRSPHRVGASFQTQAL